MKFKYPLMVFSLLVNSLAAQFYPSVSFQGQYDDNIFRSPWAVGDQIYNLSLGLEYAFDHSPVSLYYNGDFDFFNTYSNRNSNYQTFGLSYFSTFGSKKKNNQLSFGAEYESRNNEDDYFYYDYGQFYMYANIKYYDDFNGIFRSGYSYRYRDYQNYTEINNSLHRLFLNYTRSFPSRTTLIFHSELGLKGYLNYVEQSTAFFTASGHGGGWRPGGGAVTAESRYLSNLLFRAKISQSVIDNLGINAYYRKQISLIKDSKALSGDITNQDPELFNDPFSYEGGEYGGGITALLPWSINIKAGIGYEKRNYISEQAYISESDTIGLGGLREDTVNNYYLSIDKNFAINSSWIYSVYLYFDYYFMDNKSNSYWYNYKDNFYQAGINLNF
jgi:hypothetical protein